RNWDYNATSSTQHGNVGRFRSSNMGLILCLLSLVLYYFSPADLLPDLAHYHIQQVILFPAAVITLASFIMRGTHIQTPQYLLMIGTWFAVFVSVFSKLWLHGALDAFIEFSLVVCIYFLVSINAFTLARARVVCGVMVACAFVMAIQGIFAYHTGY